MAGVKGRSGTNKGKDKPYRDALRMEIAAGGDDHKVLRQIARTHLDLAKAGDMQAIKEVADRLDGRPIQQLDVQQLDVEGEIANYVISAEPMSEDEWIAAYGADVPASTPPDGKLHS